MRFQFLLPALLGLLVCGALSCKPKPAKAPPEPPAPPVVEQPTETSSGEGSSEEPGKEPRGTIAWQVADAIPVEGIGDHYQIESVTQEGELLLVKVGYSGGCNTHDFNLYSTRIIGKSLPPKLTVTLHHNANGDLCEGWITETLKFSLAGIDAIAGSKSVMILFAQKEQSILYEIRP